MSRSAWWPRLASTALVAVCAASCSQSWPQPLPTHGLAPGELALRHSLGVPDDAKQVIVFAQTSHLDIDWQRTFDDYYESFVAAALIQARQVLQAQPRAFYTNGRQYYFEVRFKL